MKSSIRFYRCACLFFALLSWITFGVPSSAAAPVTAPNPKCHYVIWKMDDVRGVSPGFRQLAEWLAEQKMKASFGVVCNSLGKENPAYFDWLKKQAIENGGVIEFWNHGFDHHKNVAEGGKTCHSEFQGTSQAFQYQHLAESNALWKAKTGLVFQTFGAPFNATDEATEEALGQIPELKVWFYGKPDAKGLLVLPRTLNLEYATGKVSYDTFKRAYQKQPKPDCLVLQGHPGMWNAESFADFKRIAAELIADKWEFITPREYLALKHAGK